MQFAVVQNLCAETASALEEFLYARRDGAILVTFDRDGNEISRYDYGTSLAGWIA